MYSCSGKIKAVMKRATLYISGSVQHAGYRKKVISIAKDLNIKGNIQNLASRRS